MNPEDLLTETLRERSERTDYPSTSIATVATRARAVRNRRRRMTVLAAAAAVAVVAVPGAVWLGRSPAGSPQPTDTTSSAPTSTATTDQNPAVLASLPQGKAPGIDYLDGDTYIGLYGERVTSRAFRQAIAVMNVRGGILVASNAFGGRTGSLTTLVANGHATQLGFGADRFALSTDGVTSAYWVADPSSVKISSGKLYTGVNNTMGESGPAYVATPPGQVIEPVGILRQGTVVNATMQEGTPRAEIIDSSGVPSPVSALANAAGSDENNDVVSGQLAGGTGTGAVIKAVDGSTVCLAPDWQFGQFSGDGRYLIGVQPADGFPNRYAIFNATTCHLVTDLEIPGASIIHRIDLVQMAWEGNDTLLAVASDSVQSAIVRFDLQGGATRATHVAENADEFRLATRP